MRCSQKGCPHTAEEGHLTTLCKQCRARIQTRARILTAAHRQR